MSTTKVRPYTRWTDEQRLNLMRLIELHGNDYNLIAKEMPNCPFTMTQIQQQDAFEDAFDAFTQDFIARDESETLDCGHCYKRQMIHQWVCENGSDAKCPLCKEAIRKNNRPLLIFSTSP